MARETVAQRNERYRVELEKRLAKEVAEYPERLMKTLARATDAYFELSVDENKFVLTNRNSRGYDRDVYRLAYAHSPNSQEQLESVEWDLDRYERELAEQRRLAEVKKEALRKAQEMFTDEERELLGL
jgi:hypothetical protein